MSVDSGLRTIARLLKGIQERANHSFALGMCALNSNSLALSVVSNFGDGDCGAGKIHTRARNFEATRREGSAEN